MDLDNSVYPDVFWNPVEGTFKSSSSSANAPLPIANEAESTSESTNPGSNAFGRHEEVVVSGSSDCEKFIENVITIIEIIIDERNILNGINNQFYDFWPEFKKQLTFEVGIAARLPSTTITQWINQATPQQ